jgi:hypothetical protein
MADYKPSPLAIGTTKARDPKASPRTSDIDLPRTRKPVAEKPLMDYDKGRATRQMTRPVFSRKVSR